MAGYELRNLKLWFENVLFNPSACCRTSMNIQSIIAPGAFRIPKSSNAIFVGFSCLIASIVEQGVQPLEQV